MSICSMHEANDSAVPCVSVPQKLWDDILDLLGDYEVCRFMGGGELLVRIRQHFDGAEELDGTN